MLTRMGAFAWRCFWLVAFSPMRVIRARFMLLGSYLSLSGTHITAIISYFPSSMWLSSERTLFGFQLAVDYQNSFHGML